MSEQEEHWYQDKVLIAFIIICGTILCMKIARQFEGAPREAAPQDERKPAIVLNAGRLDQLEEGEPSLMLTFWHVHTGTLVNGRLVVTIDYPEVAREHELRIHAFDRWEPNEEHAITWHTPLPGYDLSQRIPIRVHVEAENAQKFGYTQVWQGTTWVKDEIQIAQ